MLQNWLQLILHAACASFVLHAAIQAIAVPLRRSGSVQGHKTNLFMFLLTQYLKQMPINDAIQFINAVSQNTDLRKSLYAVPQSAILAHLAQLGFVFSWPEFDDASRLLHLRCQSEEQAFHLQQVVWWFRLQLGNMPS